MLGTAAQPELRTRPWDAEDAAHLSKMLRAFLAETQGDVEATDRSVAHLLALGLCAVANGDPCLVLCETDTPVGFTFWLGFPVPCDTRGKLCQAMGTYLIPEKRRQGLGTMLRRAAMLQAREQGYTRITATAYTSGDGRSLEAAGFTPVGRIYWHVEDTWHSPP